MDTEELAKHMNTDRGGHGFVSAHEWPEKSLRERHARDHSTYPWLNHKHESKGEASGQPA